MASNKTEICITRGEERANIENTADKVHLDSISIDSIERQSSVFIFHTLNVEHIQIEPYVCVCADVFDLS